MRIVSVFAAMDFVLLGILVGIRAVGSPADEVGQVIEPATANGKGPGTLVKGEPG